MKQSTGVLILAIMLIAVCPGIAQDYGKYLTIPNDVQTAIAQTDYDTVRIKHFPIAVQCWTFRKFTFFETLQKVEALGVHHVQAYSGQRLSKDLPDGVKFNHKMDEKYISLVKKELKKHDISVVAYGVVKFANNAKDIIKVFDWAKKFGIKTIVTEPTYDDFFLIEQLAKEYQLNIAIHNHPAPSKYWHPQISLDRIKGRDRRLGICADTGHWLRSGIVPVEALRLLDGRIIDVHLKDLNEFGKKDAHDVPFGSGKANIRDILAELTLQHYNGFLVVEHENKAEAMNPSPSIRKGLDYIRSITYYDESYTPLIKQWDRNYNKHGWNHYGPGYFILDKKTGVLKSQGGMGLFWFAEKKFKNFELLVDFKCSRNNTNSGVFVRVPNMPVSDDYIYHSFEIQIQDASTGIHGTGAVYDAEPPSSHPSKPTGTWNHYRIRFVDDRITVGLNGEQVIDWQAEPRGKIRDFSREGYIGLQNHDSRSPVYFRNIYIKELK